MADYNSLLEGFGNSTKPLDTQGDYKALLEGFTPTTPTAPEVSKETTEAVQKAPQPEVATTTAGSTIAPSQAPMGEEEAAPTETDTAAAEAIDQAQRASYTASAYGPSLQVLEEQNEAAMDPQIPEEAHAAAMEFARTEGLPVVGATVGLALAPVTGGTSFMAAMSLTAGMSGIGAFTGEAIEQTLKKADIIDLSENESMPKDGWDILQRAAWRGTEEAAWSMVPDLLIRGTATTAKRLLTTGSKPLETVDGTVLDASKLHMEKMMRDYAGKHGLDEKEVLLSSDVANVPLFSLAEDVARNSYIAKGGVEKVRDVQAEAIKEEITETIGQYMNPAKGYVEGSADATIAKYIDPGMENMNSFAVAGLIHAGFTRAQEAQKSVARGIYRTIDGLMEQSTMKEVMKEVELPILGLDGRPMSTMQSVMQESPRFPVNLSKVREFAEDKLDDSLFGTDPVLLQLFGMPSETSYAKAADALVDLKGRSRMLARSTDEAAPRRKLLVDQAIKELEPAIDDALIMADKSGVVTPDGQSLSTLKAEADGIWKEQVEDFQNSYIANIMKKADFVNGAPDKLGNMFMQNEMAAVKILKVLEDGKATLKGDGLAQIEATENAIKGSIVESIFMPYDNIKGVYTAPDTSMLSAKADTLKRLFGEESHEELVKLAGVIDTQSRQGMSNYLGFAQRARESGTIMTAIKGLTQLDFGPFIKDVGATGLFALGAGKILTSPKAIKYAAMIDNPELSDAVRIQAFQYIMHRTYEYQQAKQASMTPEQEERLQAAHDDREEATRMHKGM